MLSGQYEKRSSAQMQISFLQLEKKNNNKNIFWGKCKVAESVQPSIDFSVLEEMKVRKTKFQNSKQNKKKQTKMIETVWIFRAIFSKINFY